MDRKRGERYNQKFRCQTVERMNACENVLRLSRELGIHRRLLYKWRDQVDPADAEAEGDVVLQNTRESALRKEIAELKRLLADKTVEVNFFRSTLQKVRARRQQSDISGCLPPEESLRDPRGYGNARRYSLTLRAFLAVSANASGMRGMLDSQSALE